MTMSAAHMTQEINLINATVISLQSSVAGLEALDSANAYLAVGDANSFYLLVMGLFVFFMQAGFALLEAGSVRAKNTKNILMKNLLDACLGALIWWGWGYGIAYDGHDNEFIGTAAGPDEAAGTIGGPSFFTNGYNAADSGAAYAGWWFQYVFCAAAATIVSGAMAERTTLVGYLWYTLVISGFIYPVVVYWSWSGSGWASTFSRGLLDFAGSGIVHMTGGIAALCGAATVGPRKGRFDESKKPIDIPAHNTTFAVLGTFILWVGWYGFNPGSTLGLAGSGQTMARCVCTTTLSAAAGGVTVLTVDKLALSHTYNVGALCNGILGGLVSITAGTAAVYPWAAMIMGMLGGFVYILSSKTVLNVCKVDDPVDAFSVHGACGFWGVVAAALFAAPEFTREGGGLFYGSADYLGAGMAFLLADIAWTATLCLCVIFLPLKMMGKLRVSAEEEDAGMDVSKHGGAAYVSSS